MVRQRRYLAFLLLVSVVSFSIPSTAEAGPLLDWLFHRNRSQGLAGNTGFGNAGLGGNTSGSLFGNSCLNCLSGRRGATNGYGTVGGFAGANQNQNQAQNRATNAFAAQQNPNATTAGFAPQGGCSTGWCQQTVVRYIPQIAYRTAYQPVPVTTYKTSTSINPANGLPRTCTRPCTSYSYQARRVPYTTYRPVYTTVPVADTFGQQQQAAPTTAGFGPAPQVPNYNQTFAFQPQTAAPGCSSCQNQNTLGGGNFGGGSGTRSTIPGYTPGNASSFPPATFGGAPGAAGSPWSNAPLAGPQPGATQWRDVQPSSGFNSAAGATPWQTYGESSGNADVTPWRDAGPSGGFQGGTPADDRPRLNLNRPDYSEEFSESTFRPLTPQPMPESMRRRINGTSNSFEPSDNSYWDNDGYKKNYAASRSPQSDLFRTPTQQGYAPLNSPSNFPSDNYDRTDERNREFFRGGIRDYDRSQPGSWTDINDKTADRARGTMPLIEEKENVRTRYAAAPIQWPEERTERRERNQNQDWRNDSYRFRSGASRNSGWTPVR